MIIVIVGQMGSGKSKLGQFLSKETQFEFLEISTVVKSILGQGRTRGSMVTESLEKKAGDPLWLAEPLKQKLAEQENWIIAGVREVALLDAIREVSDSVYVLHLQCGEPVRLQRCKDKFTAISQLRAADQVDSNLGIPDVIRSADLTVNTEKSFDHTCEQVLEMFRVNEVIK